MVRKHWLTIIIAITATLFSLFLMFHTFSYDGKQDLLLIASTCWSDFGSHLPLIRSFTYGANFSRVLTFQPPEYPHFPGEPIRYHFLFYMIVGVLERSGVRIDFAFNIPSAVGFALLLVMIYVITKNLFHSRFTGLLSLVFFLFNGSFSVLSYLSKHPVSPEFFRELFTVTRFPSFGPWDGGLVSAFWNLNIYTNQRHLGLSFGLALVAIYLALVLKKSGENHQFPRALAIGMVSGILLFINQAAALVAALFAGWIILFHRHFRMIPVVVLGGLPWFFLFRHFVRPAGELAFEPGYLTPKPLTPAGVAEYWLYNLGLHFLLIPLGLALAPKKIRHLAIPLFSLFLIPNLIRFSPDMINNHKFFNFFLIIGAMFTAWTIRNLIFSGKKVWQKIPAILTVLILIFFLTASGIIDMLVIANDHKGGVPDLPANPDAQFFLNNTQPDDVILNSTWFYHPASLAGRAIFSGYPYFTWSYGYDKDKREEVARKIYNPVSITEACRWLSEYNISFVEIRDKAEYAEINQDFWSNKIQPVSHYNPDQNISYLATADICAYEP